MLKTFRSNLTARFKGISTVCLTVRSALEYCFRAEIGLEIFKFKLAAKVDVPAFHPSQRPLPETGYH